ncbi:GIN domain-containing protein [Sphingomonas japonica]|uniref:Putative auto-transporter adhesin head GIN domain-containing protein n=1 Tax=Sphingomonas japonica TaxID=511662 RepID=A0ABX0TYE0_9SPHN|nr:DUF2807 domain-containing protein [Sphingomonas japonica]NIJ23341.1 hypothetical protein [Sphingomonas japonica]
MIWILPAALSLSVAPAISADERTVMVTGFDGVRVEGPFAVEVATGTGATATIRGDSRAVDSVDVRVEDRILVVAVNPSAWGGWPGDTPDRPQIAVATPRLQSVVLTGSGRVAVDRLRGQEVVLSLTGSGAIAVGDVDADEVRATLNGTGIIALAGDARRGRFTVSGAGSYDAADLMVGDLDVVAQSGGDSSFAARGTAVVTATGLGAISVGGTAPCDIKGPGTVRCEGDR